MASVSFVFQNGDTLTAGDFATLFGLCQAHSATLDTIIAQGGAPSFVAPAGWTPTDASGAGLVFAAASAEYAVIGNIVLASAEIVYPSTVSAVPAKIGGLPYTLPNQGYASAPDLMLVSGAAAAAITAIKNSATAEITSLSTGSAVTNADLSGKTVNFQLAFPLT